MSILGVHTVLLLHSLVMLFVGCTNSFCSDCSAQQYIESCVASSNFHDAIIYQEKLLTESPNNHFLQYNLAYCLKQLGDIERAIPLYEEVLLADPNHHYAHYGLAQSYLAMGNFERGWEEFEWRMTYKKDRVFPIPSLDSLRGKRIILRAEFGFGDTFQFVRYARELKALGAIVYLHTYDALVPLLSLCPDIDFIIELNTPLPAHDLVIPLLSMPLVYKTTLATIPQSIPYLYADQQLVAYWKEKLAADRGFKIGICWQGKKNHFLEVNQFTKRSVPVKVFEPLSRVPGVTIYSLQHMDEPLANIEFSVCCFDNLDQEQGRYMDTAALIANLDLVISVDTSIVHLAGGLGIPTWVLIPMVAEWRWLREITTSPWYPTVRLFRQKAVNDWDAVMDDIIVALNKVV